MARELTEVNQNDFYSPRRGAGGDDASSRDRMSRRDEDEVAEPGRGSNSPRTIKAAKTPKRGASADADFPSEPEFIDLDQDEDAQFLRAQKRVPVRRSALPKKTAKQVKLAGMIIGAAVLVGLMASTAYGYGVHSWRFRIESSDSIEITGVHNASRAHVMEVAGADIGRNVFFVPLEERKRQLEQIPWVESATVMRLLPNHIAVEIKERVPVAFVQIGSKINLIDSNGVVMGMPANRQTKYSFPVIQGITETEPLSSRAAAMKIYNRMAGELDSGGEDGRRYTKQLSEVDLSDPEDVKVTANEGGGALLIHLGSSDFLERYKLYLAHIGEWRQQFENLQSVDLRYEGQIIVNPDKQDREIGSSGHRDIGKPVVPTETRPIHRGGADSRRKAWRKK
jgi:cell division protein FtsQ